MAQIFETLMLICFGLSWPFNISKSWKSRTAKGKSLMFELIIVVGYLCGIAGTFVTGNVTYVLIAYVINVVMVLIDILLTLRNMALDKLADRKAAKEKEAQELKRKYFGPEGELYKKRESLMMPIQDEIYTAVKEISEAKGYSMVVDRASAASVIYASPKIDISNEVLTKLGYAN